MDASQDFLRWFTANPVYFGYGEYFEGDNPPNVPFLRLLDLKRDELKPFTQEAVDFLETHQEGQELKSGIRAYSQFQDILGVALHNRDSTQNRHYCYYESLVYLREGVLSWLDGNVLAAITLLRPFLELSVLHIYWYLRCENVGYDSFYLWMDRKEARPPFKRQLKQIVANLPSGSVVSGKRLQQIIDILCKAYGRFSAYNHSPKVEESIVSLSGGLGNMSLDSFFYYLVMANIVLRQVILLYVLTYPMALFPVDRYRKWGFSGPLGLFFDSNNHSILKAYLGEENVVKIRSRLATLPEVKSSLDWIENQRDLTEEELESSWRKYVEGTRTTDTTQGIANMRSRIAYEKANLRAIGWAMNYISTESQTQQPPDEVAQQIRTRISNW